MKISLINAGKRFNREWIFRKADLSFTSGNAYAITGPNGSGKSTLLQSIAGMLQLSEGKLMLEEGSHLLPSESIHHHISFSAPYLELIEEMTLEEFLHFHTRFKPLLQGIRPEDAIHLIDLSHARHKQIRHFSSGMKQRVKLGQAILSDTPAVLLDEPCSNFDRKGIDLYLSLIRQFTPQRLVIICSNDETEYSFCNQVISIMNLKNIEQGTRNNEYRREGNAQ